MKNILLASALAVATMACSKVSYVDSRTVPTGPTSSEKGHFFLFGLVGEKEIHAYSRCPQGVAKVQSKFGFIDILANVVTVGIYSPRTYEVSCGRRVR